MRELKLFKSPKCFDYDILWETLKKGILNILESDTKKSNISFEELYRCTYNITLMKMDNVMIFDLENLLYENKNLLNEYKVQMINEVIMYFNKLNDYKIDYKDYSKDYSKDSNTLTIEI